MYKNLPRKLPTLDYKRNVMLSMIPDGHILNNLLRKIIDLRQLSSTPFTIFNEPSTKGFPFSSFFKKISE